MATTPMETALKLVKDETNLVVQSRAHFLSLLDAMDLEGESVAVKMSYVLALMSMGFTRHRAARRVGVSRNSVKRWRQKSEVNDERYLQAKSRGELMLEEVILLAAERDPEWAMNVLNKSDKESDELKEDENVIDATVYLDKK